MRSGVQAQKSRDVAGPARLREQEALVEVAAELARPLALLAVLDPLGDDPQAESVTELGDRGDDPLVFGVGPETLDERAVDLQVAHRAAASGS